MLNKNSTVLFREIYKKPLFNICKNLQNSVINKKEGTREFPSKKLSKLIKEKMIEPKFIKGGRIK